MPPSQSYKRRCVACQHFPDDQTLRLQKAAGEDDIIHLLSGLDRVDCERQEEEAEAYHNSDIHVLFENGINQIKIQPLELYSVMRCFIITCMLSPDFKAALIFFITCTMFSLLVGPSNMRVYLRDGSAQTYFTCCHTEIEVADQTFHLTQSQYTNTGPTSPSTDPITPGACQGSHLSASFQVTGMTRLRKNPAQAGFEPGIVRSRGGRFNH